MISVKQILLGFGCLMMSMSLSAKLIAVSVGNETAINRKVVESVETAAEERGWDVYIGSSGGEFQTQLSQLSTYINQGADAVIIIPSLIDNDKNKQLMALSQDVPLVFITQPPVNNLSHLPKNVFFIGASSAQQGISQIEALEASIDKKLPIAVLGDESQSSQAMESGIERALSDSSALTLLESKRISALTEVDAVMSNWCDHPQFSGVVAATTDQLALAAITALKSCKKIPEPIVAGAGASDMGLRAIEDKTLKLSILFDIETQARDAVNLVSNIFDKKSSPQVAWIPYLVVSDRNINQFK